MDDNEIIIGLGSLVLIGILCAILIPFTNYIKSGGLDRDYSTSMESPKEVEYSEVEYLVREWPTIDSKYLSNPTWINRDSVDRSAMNPYRENSMRSNYSPEVDEGNSAIREVLSQSNSDLDPKSIVIINY